MRYMSDWDKVRAILRELSGAEEIGETSTLREDLHFDSLTMVTLLVKIEDSFDMELDVEDMDPFKLKNANDVLHLVRKKRGDYDESSG